MNYEILIGYTSKIIYDYMIIKKILIKVNKSM